MGKSEKKKRQAQKPFCFYCDRVFNGEDELVNHQVNKHFKCPECPKKLNTAQGLWTHAHNVHKIDLQAVPGAREGRESMTIEIFGMNGVPEGLKPGEEVDDPSKRPKTLPLTGPPPGSNPNPQPPSHAMMMHPFPQYPNGGMGGPPSMMHHPGQGYGGGGGHMMGMPPPPRFYSQPMHPGYPHGPPPGHYGPPPPRAYGYAGGGAGGPPPYFSRGAPPPGYTPMAQPPPGPQRPAGPGAGEGGLASHDLAPPAEGEGNEARINDGYAGANEGRGKGEGLDAPEGDGLYPPEVNAAQYDDRGGTLDGGGGGVIDEPGGAVEEGAGGALEGPPGPVLTKISSFKRSDSLRDGLRVEEREGEPEVQVPSITPSIQELETAFEQDIAQ